MAVSIEGGGRPRRKDVNGDLLLVPYIDLLTCMVAFLLITAIWTQVARLEVAQKGQGQEGIADKPQAALAVVVHPDGFSVVIDREQRPLGRRGGDYDFGALGAELARVKRAHPDKTDVQILSEDEIQFDTLVKTMDAAMSSGFPDVSLLDAARAAL